MIDLEGTPLGLSGLLWTRVQAPGGHPFWLSLPLRQMSLEAPPAGPAGGLLGECGWLGG